MRCSKGLTLDLKKGLQQAFPLSRFYSQSTHDVCIVFAYLWEMGVTVIKLTGSQFCRVWIMKSYKNESQRTFSYFVAELVNFDFSKMTHTFGDPC